MKTAVIFSRVSSEGDRQSTTRQIEDLKKFADANSMAVTQIYQEHISGAKTIEERTVLSDCLTYCQTHLVDYLLLSELSRLGRSTLQVLRSLDILHKAGVSVYIQNIGLYTLMEDGKPNPIASLLTTILSEIGSIEREQIHYRLQSGKALYVKKQMEATGKSGLGRKVGYRKPTEVKAEQYKDTLKLIRSGKYSVAKVAKLTDVSESTVKRLKKEFNL